MDSLRSLLAGIDFSQGSLSALEQAARLARGTDATLHVLHVLEPQVVREVTETTSDTVDHIKELARHRMQESTRETGCPDSTECEIRVGTPLSEILEAVPRVGADLLVLGAHGSYPQDLGSLAARCVRKAPTRVLVVRGQGKAPFHDIVAGVDFSHTSRQALDEAARLARLDGATLHVLHVHRAPWNLPHHRFFFAGSVPRRREEFEALLRARLEGLVSPLRESPDLQIVSALEDNTSYGRGIVEYAANQGADLVVLGTRGETNLRYVLLGSTAERALRDLSCSVLAVKPEGFRSPLAEE